MCKVPTITLSDWSKVLNDPGRCGLSVPRLMCLYRLYSLHIPRDRPATGLIIIPTLPAWSLVCGKAGTLTIGNAWPSASLCAVIGVTSAVPVGPLPSVLQPSIPGLSSGLNLVIEILLNQYCSSLKSLSRYRDAVNRACRFDQWPLNVPPDRAAHLRIKSRDLALPLSLLRTVRAQVMAQLDNPPGSRCLRDLGLQV